MEDYMTIRETAEKWGLSVRRVQEICKLEKAPGIIKFGREWAIPRGAEKPSDLRITSGKYIQKKQKNVEYMCLYDILYIVVQ